MNFDHERAQRQYQRAQQTANGLAWFSIALGLAELLAPRTVGGALGFRGKAGLMRFYGMREIACGVGILVSRDPTPWLLARLGGDMLDGATLAAGLAGMSSKKSNVLAAMGVAGGITALDYTTAKTLGSDSLRPRGVVRDFSDRSGFKRPAAEMRGAWRESGARQRVPQRPVPGTAAAAPPA